MGLSARMVGVPGSNPGPVPWFQFIYEMSIHRFILHLNSFHHVLNSLSGKRKKTTINRPLSVCTHHLDIKEFTTLYDNILVTITAIFTSIQNARENICI